MYTVKVSVPEKFAGGSYSKVPSRLMVTVPTVSELEDRMYSISSPSASVPSRVPVSVWSSLVENEVVVRTGLSSRPATSIVTVAIAEVSPSVARISSVSVPKKSGSGV